MSAYEQIIAALNEPIVELDLAGRINYATTSALEWLQLAIGDEFVRALPDGARARFQQTFKRVAEGKVASASLETEVGQRDNTLPAEIKISAIVREGSKPTALAVWLRDMSLERAHEAAANVQGTHLLDLVENIHDACVVEGADGAIEMVNDAFCRLFSIRAAAQSFIGTPCTELFAAASSVTEHRVGPIYFELDTEGAAVENAPIDFKLTSGESVKQITLAVEGSEHVAGRLHIFHSEKARAAPETDSAQSAMQKEAIERIALELVNCVENTSSAIHSADQLDLNEHLAAKLTRAEAAATNAFEVVATLTDFSRLSTSVPELDIAPFRLRESLAAMFERIVQLAEARGVELRLRVELDVPDTLTGDGPRLTMALRDIMECILAMPAHQLADNKIEIIISPEYTADKIVHLVFSVEHHFAKGGTKPKVALPGALVRLGLARQIVRAMKLAEDPKNERDAEEAIEAIDRKGGVTYQFTAAFPFDPKREKVLRPAFVTLSSLPILIVSQDQAERKELAELVKSWRMLPREADNAAMALQLLTRLVDEGHPLPIVITSNRLPTQDGFLLAFRVKNSPKLKSTAVLLLATDGKPGDAIQCRENGINVYLRQPLSSQQLNEALTAIIGAKDDAEVDATLITRHSLREAKRGNVLIIDHDHDQAMFAAAALKKRDYRVNIVATVADAYAAMAQEDFDVIVVDPTETGFDDPSKAAAALQSHVGKNRLQPKILLASESPSMGESPYDGLVLKPFGKESLTNAIADLGLDANPQKDARA